MPLNPMDPLGLETCMVKMVKGWMLVSQNDLNLVKPDLVSCDGGG